MMMHPWLIGLDWADYYLRALFDLLAMRQPLIGTTLVKGKPPFPPPTQCATALLPPHTQVGERHVHPSMARQLAPALLQLLRVQTRYARWALVPPPSDYSAEDHSGHGCLLPKVLGLMQRAAAAITAGRKRSGR